LKEKFANNSGNIVQYLISYNELTGIPVIFIPGALVNAEEFYEDIKDNLNFPAIIISHRGLGKSSTPLHGYSKEHLVSDIRAVVLEEKLDKFFIAGHSFGTSIASAYAVKYPDKVKGLILGDYPTGYPAYPAEWAEKIISNRPEANKTLVSGLQKESKHEMFLDELAKLKAKLLILKGSNDDSLLSEKMTGKIKAAISDAELKIISNCGHELFGENPKESLQAIKDFISYK
jgi:pimeloyl-ACP methyl ester carboxylesterase